LVCLELHPGTVVHNVESFEQLAQATSAVAANIDPSHFFWMRMDSNAVVQRLQKRVGHSHAKDVVFNVEKLGLNGLLDRRWPNPPEEMPWNFATVGHGHGAEWWGRFIQQLKANSRAQTIAIEHEDPFVLPEVGIKVAAQLLAGLLTPLK
jgi:sugar phosphate isomerase/epimerase